MNKSNVEKDIVLDGDVSQVCSGARKYELSLLSKKTTDAYTTVAGGKMFCLRSGRRLSFASVCGPMISCILM